VSRTEELIGRHYMNEVRTIGSLSMADLGKHISVKDDGSFEPVYIFSGLLDSVEHHAAYLARGSAEELPPFSRVGVRGVEGTEEFSTDTAISISREWSHWSQARSRIGGQAGAPQPGEDPNATYACWYWEHISGRGVPPLADAVASAKANAARFRAAKRAGEEASRSMRMRDHVWMKANAGLKLTRAEEYAAANHARMDPKAVTVARSIAAAWEALQDANRNVQDATIDAWLKSNNE